MNPEIYALSLIDWQLFASLTFKSERLTEAVRIKMFFALMRRQADNFTVRLIFFLPVARTPLSNTLPRLKEDTFQKEL